MRAQVYKNLHVGLWSLRDPSTGLVHAHAQRVEVVDGTCRVQPAGLAKTRARRVRCVHAYVVGDVEAAEAAREGDWLRVHYNPFKAGHFLVDGDARPLLGAGRFRFDDAGAWCREPRFA